MHTTDRSIQDYLALQPLLQKVALLKELQTVLAKYLPEPLHEHCHVANWREQTLILETDSPVWKTKLLYLLPTLRDHLRAEPLLRELESIKLSTCPVSVPRARPPKQVMLSKTGEETLGRLTQELKAL